MFKNKIIYLTANVFKTSYKPTEQIKYKPTEQIKKEKNKNK